MKFDLRENDWDGKTYVYSAVQQSLLPVVAANDEKQEVEMYVDMPQICCNPKPYVVGSSGRMFDFWNYQPVTVKFKLPIRIMQREFPITAHQLNYDVEGMFPDFSYIAYCNHCKEKFVHSFDEKITSGCTGSGEKVPDEAYISRPNQFKSFMYAASHGKEYEIGDRWTLAHDEQIEAFASKFQMSLLPLSNWKEIREEWMLGRIQQTFKEKCPKCNKMITHRGEKLCMSCSSDEKIWSVKS